MLGSSPHCCQDTQLMPALRTDVKAASCSVIILMEHQYSACMEIEFESWQLTCSAIKEKSRDSQSSVVTAMHSVLRAFVNCWQFASLLVLTATAACRPQVFLVLNFKVAEEQLYLLFQLDEQWRPHLTLANMICLQRTIWQAEHCDHRWGAVRFIPEFWKQVQLVALLPWNCKPWLNDNCWMQCWLVTIYACWWCFMAACSK
jgi:hypothetical protein